MFFLMKSIILAYLYASQPDDFYNQNLSFIYLRDWKLKARNW